MNNFLSILEQNQQPPEKIIDEQKLRYIASQITIWDYFTIPQADYLALDKNEKSRMLGEYYNKLVLKYFGGKKIYFLCLVYFQILVWSGTLLFLAFHFWHFFSGKQSGSAVDMGISHAVKDSTKISMTKNVFDERVETTLTAEKVACFKCNTVDLWENFGFFKQQTCDFSMEG